MTPTVKVIRRNPDPPPVEKVVLEVDEQTAKQLAFLLGNTNGHECKALLDKVAGRKNARGRVDELFNPGVIGGFSRELSRLFYALNAAGYPS